MGRRRVNPIASLQSRLGFTVIVRVKGHWLPSGHHPSSFLSSRSMPCAFLLGLSTMAEGTEEGRTRRRQSPSISFCPAFCFLPTKRYEAISFRNRT
jgi:hypothetical protein